ncbi:hypothetical protein RvY_10101-1 [Ramazzottius varieornatus]|uniref:Uncharacterized protein n=1 Tax=Ramazzottius varieornatus TaxID=947166 RepID=A0A1D1VH05_RAMVA|nr:hypothetical protein RvY_10101-1 [Ramazzottius varieornatus]
MCVVSQSVPSVPLVPKMTKCLLKKKEVRRVKTQRSKKCSSQQERQYLLEQLRSAIVSEMPLNLKEKMEADKSVMTEVDIVLATARLIQQLEARVFSLPSPPPHFLQMMTGKQGQLCGNPPPSPNNGSIQRHI